VESNGCLKRSWNQPSSKENGGQQKDDDRVDKIVELWRQVKLLTIQQMFPPSKVDRKLEDSHFQFENPSNAMQFDKPNINRSKPQLEQSFKVELLDFQGSLNPDDFVDWLNTVKRVFYYCDVVDKRKVKLIVICLHESASAL